MDSPGQDPSSVDMTSMDAANKLAKQRIDMYQEDCKVATSVTKTAKPAKARVCTYRINRKCMIDMYS